MKMFSALLAVLILYDVSILQVLTFCSLAAPHYPYSKKTAPTKADAVSIFKIQDQTLAITSTSASTPLGSAFTATQERAGFDVKY